MYARRQRWMRDERAEDGALIRAYRAVFDVSRWESITLNEIGVPPNHE